MVASEIHLEDSRYLTAMKEERDMELDEEVEMED